MCFLPIPLLYTGEITMTVGRCTELEELFAWTNIWQIRLLVGHRKHPFPWAASPKLPSAPILKQIPVLARANPVNQHPSFYSESFRNLFITRGTEYREWLVENITWQLVYSLHRNLANGNCPWLGEAGNSNENNVCKTEHRGKTHCAWAQNLTSGQLFISGLVYKPIA